MGLPVRNVLNRIYKNTALAMTLTFVVAYTLAFSFVFGVSREVILGMLGVGVATCAIEFRREIEGSD